MSLDTLANVKTRLGITTTADDALLGLLQDSADAFVAEYCGRDFGGGTFTEYFAGAVNVLRLRNYPVSSVTSVKADRLNVFDSTSLVPTTDYIVDPDRGLIFHRYGPFVVGDAVGRALLVGSNATPRAVQVVYVTNAYVPSDVKEAYAELVGHWYRHMKTLIATQYENVTEQKAGAATVIFNKGQIAGLPLPPDVPRLLGPYRDQVI
jgi:hypothetical protein